MRGHQLHGAFLYAYQVERLRAEQAMYPATIGVADHQHQVGKAGSFRLAGNQVLGNEMECLFGCN
jgi:hypothetical protein